MVTVRGRTIPDSELVWRFSRASGPGGQHVNTTDTRVQLTFDVANTEVFSAAMRDRLLARLGPTVVVTATEHRSQLRNRRAAEERLVALLEEALRPPPRRRVATKPTRGSQRRRLDAKKQRGQTKRLRKPPTD